MRNYGAVNDSADGKDNDSISVSGSENNSNDSCYGSHAVRAIGALATAFLFAVVLGRNYGENHHAQKVTMLGSAGPYDDGHDINQPFFYDDQLVNHFSGDTATWTHRYYKSTKYFEGPGSPVFLIVGGEASLEKMLYPFVTEHLAPRFGAAVIEIEHRFYGPYRPIIDREPTTEELLELLTPQQAMADMVQLTKHFKDELECLKYDHTSKDYCPVITVGGSYPGFLSAMFRLAYPDFVDISYASSAPLKLYDQSASQYSYYDVVTKASERISPGCSNAVRGTLHDASEKILGSSSVKEVLKILNICNEEVPKFTKDLASLNENVMMSVTYAFANYDMDAYPPGKDLMLYKACQVFQDRNDDSLATLKKYFEFDGDNYPTSDASCLDLSAALEGNGNDDRMWDFQVCTSLVNPIGTSDTSMFYPHDWTFFEQEDDCQASFGVSPKPGALADALGFRDLVKAGASRILFTNGMQDMWSGGSYLENVSDSILALNFENGAHHSDLSHVGPSDKDTDDIKAGFVQITNILSQWLDEIKAENKMD